MGILTINRVAPNSNNNLFLVGWEIGVVHYWVPLVQGGRFMHVHRS